METIQINKPCEWWDDFVWASPGGTIFSTLKFLSYHPRSRFEFLNLAVEAERRPIAVIAGGEAIRDGRRFFRSPVGASFGGVILRAGCDLEATMAAVGALTAKIESQGFAGVEMVSAPACYSACADQGLRFALGAAGYRVVSQDATLAVDLQDFDPADLDPILARNLRKAEKGGIKVGAAGDLAGFYGVLVSNLAAKGVTPTHTLAELEQLVSLFPDRVILMEASLEGVVVGGCLVLVCNSRVGLAFYICDDRAHGQLRVAESALFGAASLLKRMGLRHFDLGTVSMGDQVNWGLVRFKSKFGPVTYVREHHLLEFKGAEA